LKTSWLPIEDHEAQLVKARLVRVFLLSAIKESVVAAKRGWFLPLIVK
jgi:hypothetical protein